MTTGTLERLGVRGMARQHTVVDLHVRGRECGTGVLEGVESVGQGSSREGKERKSYHKEDR